MRDAVLALVGIAIVALLALGAFQNYRRFHKPQLTTSYQAVTFVNGQTHFGRIDHLGSDHPVLRDAFSLRTEIDPATGKSTYRLLKRKEEINGADHMIVPAASIVFIEPVRPDSIVGRLIEQSEAR